MSTGLRSAPLLPTTDMMRCSRDSYMRPVDWRWQRARGIQDSNWPQTTRKRDDPEGYKWIRAALKYLRAFYQCSDDLSFMRLAERFPEVYWAHWCYDNGGLDKASLEAQILARQSDQKIGFAAGIDPKVVDAYENLFFHVREKLIHEAYVLHTVIGPALQGPLGEREYEILWKVYGYYLGPYFLRALMSKFPNANWCGSQDAVNAAIQDDAISTLYLKANVAAKTISVNQRTQLALMDVFTKFTEVERNSDSQGKSHAQFLEHVDALLECLPINVGGRDPRNQHTNMDTGYVEGYDHSAIELQYEEAMLVSTGGALPHGETLKKLTYPATLKTQSTGDSGTVSN